jgi:hypothetical protein
VLRELAALLAESGTSVKRILDEVLEAYGVARSRGEDVEESGWPDLTVAVLKDAITTAEIVSGKLSCLRSLVATPVLKRGFLFFFRLHYDFEPCNFCTSSYACCGPTSAEEDHRESVRCSQEEGSRHCLALLGTKPKFRHEHRARSVRFVFISSSGVF